MSNSSDNLLLQLNLPVVTQIHINQQDNLDERKRIVYENFIENELKDLDRNPVYANCDENSGSKCVESSPR